MTALGVALCVLAIGSTWAAGVVQTAHAQDSVVSKVIEMLQENKMKVAADLNAEEKEMSEYARFCDKETSAKGYAIKTAKRKITDLSSNIEDATAQIDSANSDIASLGTETASKGTDLSGIEKVRASERGDFESIEKELEGSVGELDKSIILIKRGAGFLQTRGKRPSKKDVVREIAKALGSIVDAAWVPHDSSVALKGFLQQHGTEAADAELTLNADAKAQGGGIVQVLEDMKTKAEEALTAARQEEMKANHNFQMMKQSIVQSMDTLKEKLSDTKKAKAEETEGMGKANGELSSVRKTMASDNLLLEGLQHDCQQAGRDWEERQKSAKGEMAAIDTAVGILSDRVKVLTQTNGDFLTGSELDGDVDTSTEGPERRVLVTKLRDLGHKFSSYALAELAGAAASDPFGKVRTLIEDMVAKLVAEANEDATQKQFCDEEKAKSGKEKDKKSMRADELQNRLDTAEASKASLLENIKELQEEIGEIDSSTKEATQIRAEEKGTATKAAADFKSGAEAVTEAVHVLRDYYANAAALPQLSTGAKQPKLGGKSDAAGTIISILENCGEEFTKMYMQVTADEEEAAQGYKQDMDKSKVSRDSKNAEIKNSESEIKALEVSLTENGEDLKMTQKELDAVLSYIEKLKPQCETKAMTFEEKAARRTAEIEGLKEALTILDQGALVQTNKK